MGTGLITKALISLYDLIPVSKKVNNKKVLIVFGGVIGDSVLFCDSLWAYKELYKKSDGYEITVYTTMGASGILNEYVDGIKIIGIDFKKLNTDWKYHKEVIKKLQENSYELVINPFPAHSNEVDSIMLKAKTNRRVQLIPEEGYSLNLLEKLTNKCIKEAVKFNTNMSELERYAQVLKYLGLTNFEESLPLLPPNNNYKSQYLFKNKYCVLAIGGSTPCKQWPGNRFAQIANYIIDKYDYDIVLTGGKGEEYIFDNIKPFLNKEDRVHSLIGKTSLIDLVEIIRNSGLLVGNDSSSVHIAAATNTAAICVVGGWDYGRMYPYRVKKERINQKLPIAVYNKMNCFGCAKIAIGHKNTICKKCIDEKIPYPCIDIITEDDVIKALDKLMADLKFNNEI